MSQHQLISGVLIEHTQSLTLDEFARVIKVKREIIIEMVEYRVIEPQGKKPEEWRFDSTSLKRGRTASSFYRDLEVNMAGIALALDLLEQIEDLRQQISIYQKK